VNSVDVLPDMRTDRQRCGTPHRTTSRQSPSSQYSNWIVTCSHDYRRGLPTRCRPGRSILTVGTLRFVTDGTGSATKPILLPCVGLRGIVFCVGRRGRLTCFVSALAVADTESTASFPRTEPITTGCSLKLTARIPRRNSWVLRLYPTINRVTSPRSVENAVRSCTRSASRSGGGVTSYSLIPLHTRPRGVPREHLVGVDGEFRCPPATPHGCAV
jgi:hypothetical protein